jgi:hypothetical protein
VRRIGVLMSQAADDPEGQPPLLARAGAAESGWTIGRNRGSRLAGAPATMTGIAYAAELVGLAPDVMLVNGPAALAQRLAACRLCSRLSSTQ